MIIETQSSLGQLPAALLVPLAVNPMLGQSLRTIADLTGHPAEALRQDFSAEAGEQLLLYAGDKRVYLIGLGESPNFGGLLKAFRSFSHKQATRLPSDVGISLMNDNLTGDAQVWVEAAVNGLLLGTYQIGRFKRQEEARQAHPLLSSRARIIVLAEQELAEGCQAAAERGQEIAAAQLSIIDLVNAPSNKKTPAMLADWALQSGKTHGYQVQVMGKEEITANGLHALLAVNRGSEDPPRFIIMEYRPKQPTAGKLPKVGLVGKGVTFDTGGLSIKPSANLHYMKSDMGGAAAVFGTMEAAARLKLPVHLIGIVPATDNCVDAAAIKPSDVIASYSGKTIEIIDTDAEGRLILADGLAYMTKHYAPEVMIDLATLTGSAVRTFGYHAGALFSNSDSLAAQLSEAGMRTGERLWQLPLWDVYAEDIKSDVADVRNFSGRPMAGAIAAAKFLESFIDGHPNWAHMDIAGVAFGDSELSIQKSATGFGVRLLIDFLAKLQH